jgi:hypothetical protein
MDVLGWPRSGDRYATLYVRRGSRAGLLLPPVALADVGQGVLLSRW